VIVVSALDLDFHEKIYSSILIGLLTDTTC